MSFGEIVNLLLYIISGLCFGTFASRYSVLSALHIREKYTEEGISCLFSCIPQILFLFCCFFLFPSWFTTRTTAGGFVYYVALLFFFSKGYRLHKK